MARWPEKPFALFSARHLIVTVALTAAAFSFSVLTQTFRRHCAMMNRESDLSSLNLFPRAMVWSAGTEESIKPELGTLSGSSCGPIITIHYEWRETIPFPLFRWSISLKCVTNVSAGRVLPYAWSHKKGDAEGQLTRRCSITGEPSSGPRWAA